MAFHFKLKITCRLKVDRGEEVRKRGIPEGGTTEDMPRKFLTNGAYEGAISPKTIIVLTITDIDNQKAEWSYGTVHYLCMEFYLNGHENGGIFRKKREELSTYG